VRDQNTITEHTRHWTITWSPQRKKGISVEIHESAHFCTSPGLTMVPWRHRLCLGTESAPPLPHHSWAHSRTVVLIFEISYCSYHSFVFAQWFPRHRTESAGILCAKSKHISWFTEIWSFFFFLVEITECNLKIYIG
jgi:hypothetical protein